MTAIITPHPRSLSVLLLAFLLAAPLAAQEKKDTSGRSVKIADVAELPVEIGEAASIAGRPVILGIRPEHLEIVQNDEGSTEMIVTIVEQLGADTLVHGHFGADQTPDCP